VAEAIGLFVHRTKAEKTTLAKKELQMRLKREEAAPADVPGALHRRRTQGQFAHGRSDAVSTDEEVVLATRAIGEFDGDAMPTLGEG
jgi:hypothetical protein